MVTLMSIEHGPVTNFHLHIIQLWQRFFDIFVDADVVQAQSGEAYSLKNPVEPP